MWIRLDIGRRANMVMDMRVAVVDQKGEHVQQLYEKLMRFAL